MTKPQIIEKLFKEAKIPTNSTLFDQLNDRSDSYLLKELKVLKLLKK